MNRRYCLTLDLKNDPVLISQYEAHHKAIWPEIVQSIKSAGIVQMEIYRTGNRLCMIMEVDASFSFERKQQSDLQNEKVQQWEELMWKYQQALPWVQPGEKWILMDQIFQLTDY